LSTKNRVKPKTIQYNKICWRRSTLCHVVLSYVVKYLLLCRLSTLYNNISHPMLMFFLRYQDSSFNSQIGAGSQIESRIYEVYNNFHISKF